jgi:hypothetical protein
MNCDCNKTDIYHFRTVCKYVDGSKQHLADVEHCLNFLVKQDIENSVSPWSNDQIVLCCNKLFAAHRIAKTHCILKRFHEAHSSDYFDAIPGEIQEIMERGFKSLRKSRSYVLKEFCKNNSSFIDAVLREFNEFNEINRHK